MVRLIGQRTAPPDAVRLQSYIFFPTLNSHAQNKFTWKYNEII